MDRTTRRVLRSIGAFIALSLFLSISVFAQGHGPVVNRVTVGGHDGDFTVLNPNWDFRDANFSLIAIEYEDGYVRGQFVDRYFNDVSNPGNEGGLRGMVTCLRVIGNRAWIGGYVTSGSEEPYFFTSVRDNGTSNMDPPDEISFGFAIDLEPILGCPPIDVGMLPMPDGQVKIN